MLCPKCGFISFDHSSACGKCHNDLSSIEAELRGTVADVEGRYFLGTLIREATGLQGSAEEVAVSSTAEIPLAPKEVEAPGEETLIIDEGEAGQGEAVSFFVADEAPALEFDLDEIPHLESAERDRTSGAGKTGEEVSMPVEAELGLPALDSEEGGEAATVTSEAIEAGPPALELDSASLSLESGAEVSLAPAEEVPDDESQSGQMTIDLNSIDLSDLVHPGKESAVETSETTAPAGGLELDDTMDLSLFTGDANHAPLSVSGPASNSDGLSPIDLSLVDDALEDLVADPARKEAPPPAKGGGDIVELSMESDK